MGFGGTGVVGGGCEGREGMKEVRRGGREAVVSIFYLFHMGADERRGKRVLYLSEKSNAGCCPEYGKTSGIIDVM